MPRATAPVARRAVHEVRIIGGQWKRTRLPVADKPGLRPTPDRVRETLFNWLGQDLGGWRCVDAFAGSGALGLEAASRGAAQVLLVEQDPELVATLRSVKARLSADTVEVRRANGLSVLKDLAGTQQDLVFLDPPFDADLFDKAVAAAVPTLAPQGLLYLEAPTAWSVAQAAGRGLELRRHIRAGAVHAHLLGLAAGAAP
ncbi:MULTISPECIES: 16S rRNA (guanine(966)-N(2))-methyltransferase RsmD [Ramlibacter]|uniref:16S rRNA (Guanine(966)-N(2))-methyltransferase RsmD n=1 Tax=Ramlibacter pinisoli TaxID=2682844 RepID=A0A6N8IVP8_9BURK|nr:MULTISPECIES: 16S rRNA (guanine(966)-N(2))-methyltransferase RsmD [Ramlibacter]MBA2965068.1 16S rRNA (guanine(966)-N(2))-methyltransferase RsmD [Ramlibacter sp. CGMCC 1.13660]MVQ30033.1 16S rRNA (guanine(966)-N(2))-methyltransferase RsmD [Ramlibacter pinisoli]